MPRGRHRHSPPLHRILPPAVVAGVPVVCAAGAWLLAEPLPLRALVAVTAAAAVTGGCLMRSWDRAAGLRVAELTRARASDEWKAEERIAELEADLEESRELRTRLETKLRRKRVELAGLRGEHAALLRRYANAETERASALEGRRQLAIEASAPRELLPARSTPTPGAYQRAAQALQELPRNAALQEARRTAELARQRDIAERSADRDTEGDGPAGKHAAVSGAGDPQHRRAQAALPAPQLSPAARPPRAVPAASAVAPYDAARRQLVPQGSFDFFGTQKANAAIESVQNEDLADVVGEEALAAHRTGTAENRAVGKVIDLTAHDDTEQLDVVELRSAIS
uniref:Secreted protein n=1 Tax=Streptomyces sp. NBC_01401 TaxID=2903854 RepID=A0AAU3GY18_9ACTN